MDVDGELRDELIAMADADQAFRTEGRRFTDRSPDDVAAERARGRRIAEIVEVRGWPGVSLVGDAGASAAWLLVQHADQDPDFQDRALALLAQAAAEGDASAHDAAFLTDRVRVHRGRPQLYGTQFRSEDGVATPFPIEDPDGLDARRAAAGIEPFEENRARIQHVIDELARR
jgi:hypothetical protein